MGRRSKRFLMTVLIVVSAILLINFCQIYFGQMLSILKECPERKEQNVPSNLANSYRGDNAINNKSENGTNHPNFKLTALSQNASKSITGLDWLRSRHDRQWCQFLVNNKRVNPHPYKFVINAESLCYNVPYLLIVIPSVCNHTDTRKQIRRTWGSVVHTRQWSNGEELPPIKVAFLFGKPIGENCLNILEKESETHKDIIASEFIDSYRNLTLKSVSLLKWVTMFCQTVPYVMKCDEDTFVYLPELIRLIKKVNSTRKIIGHISKYKKPFSTGRWGVTNEEYPFRFYPPYVQGQVYIIPGGIIRKLFVLSEYFHFLPIEDVFVTGIISKCAGAMITQFSRRTIFGFRNYHRLREKMLCFFKADNNKISVTKTEPSDLLPLWESFKNTSSCYRNETNTNGTNTRDRV